jgi:hypothetical protein
MIYAIIDQKGDLFETIFNTAEAAVAAADKEWARLSAYDKSRRESYTVVEGKLDEDGRFDYGAGYTAIKVYADDSLTDYQILRINAVGSFSTTEDRLALYEWMENNDMRDWNGECFDIDDGLSLYPVYDEKALEDDEVVIIDAEVR